MRLRQQLLFSDPQPLVETLGQAFFRTLPEAPGVYLMKSAEQQVLYVGKAKNLRKRLSSYRVANPDRMPRRHLRLLRLVASIEIELLPDERSALARESDLLRSIRPRFNRLGTWSPPPRWIGWCSRDEHLHLALLDAADPEWRSYSARGVLLLRSALVRLLWIATRQSGIARLPVGWLEGKLPREVKINCGTRITFVFAVLEKLFAGEPSDFMNWVCSQLPPALHPLEKTMIDLDLEILGAAPNALSASGGLDEPRHEPA